MPSIKRNFFIGIKTPWTLASERVWKKTHEMGGKVFMGTAVLILVGMLFPDYTIWFMLVPLLGGIGWIFIYSYLEFRKEKRKREGINSE